jgi:hypothetical protein
MAFGFCRAAFVALLRTAGASLGVLVRWFVEWLVSSLTLSRNRKEDQLVLCHKKLNVTMVHVLAKFVIQLAVHLFYAVSAMWDRCENNIKASY